MAINAYLAVFIDLNYRKVVDLITGLTIAV
jgi:hypothetical protein